ncbi:hypothetical protein [Bradyrhizobium icense]|uniref:Uncharacterized protein n=1 Tax=Bradyrhizobium icense TaxID=1274631 RepID=A0A1B1UIA5_9BRAD|nr:hypothetical protein [Bradyrhizobium icense]ANW02484.1 hypothetical protein LMTR13_22240 [Bradyrhizobium icense]
MVKILLGLVAAVVIAAGGFFGFEFYTQHRITREVDAAFEQIRASGGKASHGKVSFDLRSRTLRIDDIATESASQPPVSVKIASLTASGVGLPDAAKFSADNVEWTDLEVSVAIAGPTGGHVTYKVPQISVKDYSGPGSLPVRPASASIVEAYRAALEQFAAVSASSVVVPSIVGTINFGAITSGNFTYSGTALRDIKNGKIASMQIERLAFTANTQQAGKADKLTGEIANFVSHDFDAAAAAAILDPQKANDDKYYRFYGQATAGAYIITSAQGVRMRIDGMTIDDVSLRPSRLQLPTLLALMQPAGGTPTAAQTREMMDKMAKVYEAVRVGTAEMRGISAETPEGPFKLAAARFNLEDGKVGEFAIEGLDGRSPKGPVKVGRFALKSLDVAGLLRMAAQFSNPGQQPSPDKALALIPLIEGVELNGLMAPFKDTGKPVNVDTFSLDWGQFVGPIPSKVRLKLKMSAPIDSSDPRQQILLGAGLDTAAIDLDVGAAWTEASKSFALEPVSLEFGGLLKASARVSLSSVPRGLFSPDLARATAMAAEIEAGTLEFTMHDSGFLDLANTLNARVLNVSREEARRSFVDKIRDSGRHVAATKPDAAAAAEMLARFIETPGQTLIIKLAPIGKVSALRFIELFKADPDNANALAQFRIEASTGL